MRRAVTHHFCRAAALLVALALVGVGEAFDKKEPTPTFSERLIADKYGYAFGVAAADLDGDGDLDLVSCDTTNDVLYWYENDGKGKFTRHVIQDKEKGWFERHAVGDLDGDGLPDVVVVKNLDGHLVWFQNTGKPKEKWTRRVISTDCKRAYDVALADLDGDGKLDVVASTWVGNHVAWYENPGKAGHGKEWKKHLIDDKIAETRTVRVADFNGDKRPDVLVTARAANLVAWYENSGKPREKWKRHVIDDKSPSPTHGHPIDLDGDGDVDVVMALGMLQPKGTKDTNQIVWYENVGKPGDGTKWKKHVIGELVGAFEAFAADLNGDGKPDVIATAWGGGGRVVWFENPGDPAGKWTMHVLKEKWANANQVIAADLDGDKRMDVIATAERGANELRWWRNEGKKR
jgi:hypothetical protein